MYIKDDVCYASEPSNEIEIKGARVLGDGMMMVEFTTGEKRLFDTTLLRGDAFKPLSDERVLADFTVNHGLISWGNGDIDIAPEAVYDESYPYNESAPVVGRDPIAV